MTIPGHKSYVKDERYAKGEDYLRQQLKSIGRKMKKEEKQKKNQEEK